LLITVGALIVIDIGAIVAILVSGGFSWNIGSTTISAHDLFNPMQALGVLAVVAIWAFLRPSVRAVANHAAVHRGRVAAAMTIAIFALLAAPICGVVQLFLAALRRAAITGEARRQARCGNAGPKSVSWSLARQSARCMRLGMDRSSLVPGPV
jgi:hypothetical protein